MLTNLKIGTKIGASFALGLTALATFGIFSYRNTNELIENAQWQNHTYLVLEKLDDLNSHLKDIETSQRGYLITGNQSYLYPYKAALPEIQQDTQTLRKLTKDNSTQQHRLNTLEPIISEKLAVVKDSISLRDNKGLEAARQLVMTEQGHNLMLEIRQIITEMQNEERVLLDQRTQKTQVTTNQAISIIVYGIPLTFILLTFIGIYLSRNISKPLQEISDVTEKLAAGDLSVSVSNADNRRDEIGLVIQTLNEMIANLRQTTLKSDEQNWLKSNLAKFSQMLQGHRNLETVGRMILSELAPLVGAQHGLFVTMNSVSEQPMLKLISSYAYQRRKHLSNEFRLGEGLVGQCALEKQKIILTNAPSDYIQITSGLGEARPLNIIVLPVQFEDQVVAVIELASFEHFNEIHLSFLDQVTTTLGVVLNTIVSDTRTQELLQTLQASEVLLKEQQQELQQSNEELQQLNAELEEKAELLAIQNKEVEQKNQQIEQARKSLEEKASQLALSSKYKSEFLANMSHELRTPLNSLLILAKLLADNVEGNLTAKQVEYSQTIYSSGNDLLLLISDILDLAKIESGTMSVEINQVVLLALRDNMQNMFEQLAADKGLRYTVELAADLPAVIETDAKRLQQVLKNLLSNAFKFTEPGEVNLQIEWAKQGWSKENVYFNQLGSAIAFRVRDTGIGIAQDKQKIIFEAFQQADGTTSRRYEGTGLGLSISREIAHLLNGEITLVSRQGQDSGSVFTLYLPYTPTSSLPKRNSPTIRNTVLSPSSTRSPKPVVDDSNSIQPGDRTLLIVEDDVKFAQILLDMAHQHGFKVIVANNGHQGLSLAQQFQPVAIILDLSLPGINGWTVLERLKQDANTRHIPVHIMSVEEQQQRGLQQGAIAYLQKPISADALHQALTKIKGFVERAVKNLLVVEDDDTQRQSIVELIGNGDVVTTAVATGQAALDAISTQQFDCVVLDLGLPDMSGFELISQIKQQPHGQTLPIIVYTARELTRGEDTQLQRIAQTVILKDVRSPERLLDETALFLHRVQASLPTPQRQILEQLHSPDSTLRDKKVLIVDDDVRNIFALTSLLERYQMHVLYAENGRDGLAVLQSTPDIDLVLMDIMMPEMDGYETMRLIRQQSEYKSLPIIALTAKAMLGDRDKCIQAGASDYITKPVDSEQLLSLIRVWLYQ